MAGIGLRMDAILFVVDDAMMVCVDWSNYMLTHALIIATKSLRGMI